MNRHGDAPAVISESGVLTYGRLDRRAARYSAALVRAGLRPGDIVVITVPDGPDAIAALLAAQRARTPFVWLTVDQPLERRLSIVADCAPRAVLAPAGSDPFPVALVQVDGDEAVVVRRATGTPPRSAVPPGTEYVAYTSGSTGTPKGIMQRTGNLDQLAKWLTAENGVREDSRLLQWARLTYDAAYVEILTALHGGAALIVPPEEAKGDAARIHEWIVQHEATHLQTVPSLCRHLLDACPYGSAPVEGVRTLSLFGESLHVDLVHAARRHFPKAVVHNFYGPTECILATWQPVPEEVIDPIPLGRAIPGREILLTDDNGDPVPDGEVGEIRVRSGFLAHGYLNRPEETREVFLPERTYRTGDLGRRTPDGGLLFAGRSDDQIKIRGARVELGEIEAALYREPTVAQGAVRTYGDNPESLRLAAYVQPRPDTVVDVPALHRRLTRTLPTYMIPASYVVVDQMPLTATGKIDRLRLPAPDARHRAVEPVEFSTETERGLGVIWCEVIGCEQAGPDDDFFTVGGYSLLAPQITAEVLERFGIELPVRAVFDHPTLRELSARIDHELASASPRTSDHTPDHTPDHAVDQVTEQVVDHAPDRTAAQMADQTVERNPDAAGHL
ncbi:non-ribosomal peptide synthetase [Streptosporangium sp. NPDC051022]|uniref:non-ribosomal peptide synthetase n=1 Tax=Streptosporangium sp. NPDC051022 TaxID=3155752 RepID=UPI0034470F21